MNPAKLFKPKACSVSLVAATKEGCFSELTELLIVSGQVPQQQRRALELAFGERERLASTGVGAGVAIPHVQLPGLAETALSFAVHKRGVDWASVDGEPAHLFFAVVRPGAGSASHDPKLHLELMQWIARLSRAKDFCRFAKAVRTKSELMDLLKEVARA